jgi:hypothetical protein
MGVFEVIVSKFHTTILIPSKCGRAGADGEIIVYHDACAYWQGQWMGAWSGVVGGGGQRGWMLLLSLCLLSVVFLSLSLSFFLACPFFSLS